MRSSTLANLASIFVYFRLKGCLKGSNPYVENLREKSSSHRSIIISFVGHRISLLNCFSISSAKSVRPDESDGDPLQPPIVALARLPM